MTCGIRRVAIAATGAAELTLSYLFYFRPQIAFGLLGRPLLDPVIARQYGLFLVSVALLYGIWSLRPKALRRIVWIALAQRFAEVAVAIIDWRAGELPARVFFAVLVLESAVAAILFWCSSGSGYEPAPAERGLRPRSDWLVRVLVGFGGLQLFWMFASTIFVQFGTRLLGWKLQDAYTTQQQGIALFVIGLTSLLAASDVRRYRWLIWVPLSSQILGMLNAVNEVRLGTIPLGAAAIQWAIEGAIVAALLVLSSAREGADRRAAVPSPLV